MTQTEIPSGLDVALGHGFRVFPCRAGDKRPLTKHGCKDASDEVTQVIEWSREFPDANWGAAMGDGLFALDLDRKGGTDGTAEVHKMEEQYGPLPNRLTNQTPSGGEHYIFRGVVVGNTASKVAPGVDVRTDGGYICIPPSALKAGPYRWREPNAPIPEAPSWLIGLLARQTAKRSERKAVIPSKERNRTLFAFTCALRSRAVPESDAWTALQLRNQDCDPPLDEREVQQVFTSAWRYPPGFALTDLGNRDRLVRAHGNDLRNLIGGGWHTWTGHRFEQDRKNKVVVLTGEVVRAIYAEAAAADDADQRKALALWAKASESRGRIESAISLAESHPNVVDLLEEYDQNPWLIGLLNGVYDLEHDEFRPGRREDRITKAMNVVFDARATCPSWQQFQNDIHPGKPEIVSFKQRAFGHSMSGDTSEQVAYQKYGTGANGKTVEQEAYMDVMGDYGITIAPEVLMTKDRRGGASNEVVQMRGARVAATGEVEEGQSLAENLFKRLTGEDKISGRFLYQEHINFRPTAKFWISTNNRPEIRGTDYAIWRRILVIPYDVRFTDDSEPRRDPKLRGKLLEERAGIFNWLLEGFRQWHRLGLMPPDEVRAATAQYRDDMNRIANFVKEQTRPVASAHIKSAEVYRRFVSWWKATGLKGKATPAKDFHAKLVADHGFVREPGGERRYLGCGLVTWEYEDDDSL